MKKRSLLSPTTLIQSRHSLHRERLSEYNAKFNAGEKAPGLEPYEDLSSQTVAVLYELEHLADALGIELEERLNG